MRTHRCLRQSGQWNDTANQWLKLHYSASIWLALESPAQKFRQTGIYLLIGDPKNRTSIVSTDDVARIAVDSVIGCRCSEPDFAGRRARDFTAGGYTAFWSYLQADYN